MTEQEWADYLREHDGIDVSWDVIHHTMTQVWASLNGDTPMPDKYPEYILDNLDMNFKVLFYDIAHMKDLIISGGTVAWFASASARDTYYTANPDKLKSGISVGIGDPVSAFTYDGTNWISGALGFRGIQGEPGNSPAINANGNWWVGTTDTGVKAAGNNGREVELQVTTDYIQWRLTGTATWINLVALSSLEGADGREINLRMSGTILQWQFVGDSNWQDLYDFSSVSIPAKINEYVVGANYVANNAFIDPVTKYAYHVIADYTAVSIASDLAAGRIYQFGGGTVDLSSYAKSADVTAAIGVETTARTTADTALQDNIDAEAEAREGADALAVKKAGDTMTGALILNGDPVDPKGAVTKEWAEEKIAEAVSDALTFKGFISDTTAISDLREGNLVYIDTLAAGTPPSAVFPWTGMKVFTNGALEDAPDYTPTINEEWRDRVNSETWFYSGDEWERLDFNGSVFNSDDFDVSSGEVAIKAGAITDALVADNAGIQASKISGFNTLLQYPIGSIYMSVNPTNPSVYFGGTWEAWGAGRVPVGVDAAQTEFATVEQTNDASTKVCTLTEQQMPSHTHSPKSPVFGTGTYPGFNMSGAQSAGAVTTLPTGGGQPHNNLQPYITCFMFKRTA